MDTQEGKEKQRLASLTLRKLIDAIIGNVFISTINNARKITYENQGRAISVSGIRALATKYIGNKSFNEARQLRESKKEKEFTRELIENRPWKEPKEIDDFISKVQGTLEKWKDEVCAGKKSLN